MRQRWAYLTREVDGQVSIQFNASKGARAWSFGGAQTGLGHQLDTVKEYVLAWPTDPKVTYPHLYLSRQELFAAQRGVDPKLIRQYVQESRAQPLMTSDNYGPSMRKLNRAVRAYLLSGDAETAQQTDLVTVALAQFQFAVDTINGTTAPGMNGFDFMRCSGVLINTFDALIDSGLLKPTQQRLLRAQMAYIGYWLASPDCWSAERGYSSGNPDMHVSFIINKGMVGCALPDHPEATNWSASAVARLDKWMQEVGPAGEWPENTHYTNVSLSAMLPFVIAARNSGINGTINSKAFKAIFANLGKEYAPPDPRYSKQRTLVSYGKGTAGERFAVHGILACALATIDPDFSATQQWLWNAAGNPLNIANSTFFGFEDLIVDRSLPSHVPGWTSEVNGKYALLLHGFATAFEHYVHIFTTDNVTITTGDRGNITALYGYGQPLTLAFGNGERPWTQESPLKSHVQSARSWGVRAEGEGEDVGHLLMEKVLSRDTVASFLPRLQYLRLGNTITQPLFASRSTLPNLPPWPMSPRMATGDISWTRQVLCQQGDEPTAPLYYLFRDSVENEQPTEWTMWTLSEGLFTPSEAPIAKSGENIQQTRLLPVGDRYTARGQYGIDIDYYIAAPADSPRYTMRWGYRVGQTYNAVPEGLCEYQDLLYLRLPGRGYYFVAYCPRKATTPAPIFATLGGGSVIKVTGAWGTDYGFLSMTETKAEGEGALFIGTAASIQNRQDGLVLSLAAKG
ncbi:MAG TPA: hypothetical protein VGK81_05715, partial [Anaerolineae bacterium]